MRRIRRQEPYLKVLTSRWVMFPLLLIVGFAGGFVCASHSWARSGYQLLPSEIIVRPPKSNLAACFPDRGFIGALKLQQELRTQMHKKHLQYYSDSVVRSSIHACVTEGNGAFALYALHASPQQFRVLATATGGFTPYHNYTLVTESGCYYLHPIPKKWSSDYDSLIQIRWRAQAKP